MSEVKLNVPLFKVSFTEHERGWGSKHWDEKFFDNEAEAKQHAIDYNKEHNNKDYVPDWYVRADYEGRVG
jgi:hypothetical protein